MVITGATFISRSSLRVVNARHIGAVLAMTVPFVDHVGLRNTYALAVCATGKTVRILTRRADKRGKLQLRPLAVPCSLELLQRSGAEKSSIQKQEDDDQAMVRRFVIESVQGPMPKSSRATKRGRQLPPGY